MYSLATMTFAFIKVRFSIPVRVDSHISPLYFIKQKNYLILCSVMEWMEEQFENQSTKKKSIEKNFESCPARVKLWKQKMYKRLKKAYVVLTVQIILFIFITDR